MVPRIAMTDSNFVYIWKYAIRLERESEFLAAYQPDGDWAQLFSRDPNYVRTELLRDASENDVYVTIDYWKSKSARDQFRQIHTKDFDEIDKRCEAYTVSEDFVGDFVVHDECAT
jgi:hypothetical protein